MTLHLNPAIITQPQAMCLTYSLIKSKDYSFMKLNYFRQFLIEKLIKVVYSHQKFSGKDIGLFLKDSKFDINPFYEQIEMVFQAFDNLGDIEMSDFDETEVLKHVFALAIKLDNFSLGQVGLSLKTLNALALAFYTDEIYMHGDGHCEVYSEETTFPVQEVILRIVLNDRSSLIAEYKVWLEQAQNLVENEQDLHGFFH